ncbi:30S ribosomal protein S13 [candidate division WOR-3 bacterium RBG_13_43_14]|uniref:Small ribosomal subunit protein uS13 n=1 Tax=candidate division WOR-3 bacterium RBG_13_43_14 TaxID=1802590 RepID=A0A1F4UBZ2_UNCW3|nr:MAG: 30S ribosomal protein S13 [candidate division WOR-3 bacterium RBG_13_43_14]
MARIAGIDLPPNKRIAYGLTAIFGIGLHSAQKIVATIGIDPAKKIKDLTDDEITSIRKLLETEYKVEGALRAEIASDIKRLIDINAYRGMRHRTGLPARGQRTRTNARTRKGKRKTVAGKSSVGVKK